MGRPMAGHLIAGGHKLFLHGHGTSPKELLDKGAVSCSNARDVARAADIIITKVPDTPNVEDALFGPEGAAEGVSPGKIIVDMSSISPIATKDFAKRINELGCDYLDAPVSGGDIGAKNGA
jgi:2-hydroxy-3-oxopropionate reductase